MVKVNPIVSWTQKQVDGYITENGVMVNPLVYDGYGLRRLLTVHPPDRARRRSPQRPPDRHRKAECGIHL